jgi:hypothetical protein
MADSPHHTHQVMENPTQFDLNEAVRQWRRGLESSAVFRATTLEELEAHLRDSTLALHSDGLTEAEAFLIARRRLGNRAELEREFGKANAHDLWVDRCLWMILGLLLFLFSRRLSIALENGVLLVASAWGLSAHWAGALCSLIRWMAPAAGIAAVLWFGTRKQQIAARLARHGLRWWWLTGVVLVTLLYNSYSLGNHLMEMIRSLLTSPSSYPPGDGAILMAWVRWTGPIEQLLWIVLVPVLAGYVQRLRGTEPRLSLPANTLGIAEDQRGAVQQLQVRGLSREEACFVAAYRRDHGLEAEPEGPNPRLILAERALWMVLGVMLNTFLCRFLLDPCWIVAAWNHHLTHQTSVYGHVSGGLCLLLELSVAALFGTAFWRFVTRPHRSREWIASLCMKRPGRAAVGLVLIYLGMERGFWLLGSVLSSKVSPGLGSVASRWYDWQYVLLQMVIPVALLLWLARYRSKSQSA